jgi:hypothetical protein
MPGVTRVTRFRLVHKFGFTWCGPRTVGADYEPCFVSRSSAKEAIIACNADLSRWWLATPYTDGDEWLCLAVVPTLAELVALARLLGIPLEAHACRT